MNYNIDMNCTAAVLFLLCFVRHKIYKLQFSRLLSGKPVSNLVIVNLHILINVYLKTMH